MWQNWGANENRKFASLQGDYTGIWSGGRYKFANHITEATGTLAVDPLHMREHRHMGHEQDRLDYVTTLVSDRLQSWQSGSSTWGSTPRVQTAKSTTATSMWEVNGVRKNGIGQGGFGKKPTTTVLGSQYKLNLFHYDAPSTQRRPFILRVTATKASKLMALN